MPHESQWISTPVFRIALSGKSKTDTLLETVSFLSDFNTAYELARLASDDTYTDFSFSPYVWMRNGRPLRQDARLRVVRLSETSPLELVTTVAVAGLAALPSILILVTIIEKAYNIQLNHRKLKADVEKAERENRIGDRIEHEELERRAERIMSDPRASQYLENTTRRLSRSTVVVKEMTVTYEIEDERRDGK